jgi:hypothetical protein
MDDVERKEAPQVKGEGKTTRKVPRSDVWVGLTAIVLIILHDLFWFMAGYNPNLPSALEFVAFCAGALLFLGATIIVLASLVMLFIRWIRYWPYYSKRDRLMRAGLAVVILLRVLCHPTIMQHAPLLGVRLKVATTGGVDELQKWAVKILDMPIEEVVSEEDLARDFLRVKKDLYSEQVRQIATMWVFIGESDDGERSLNFPLAGGFVPGWSIRVGRPGFRGDSDSDSDALVQRWGDGVYGFSF